jgi:hypothetical protein
VAKITALVPELEQHGFGTLWIDTLDALATIDGVAAAKYVTEFLGRANDWRMSMPGGTSKTAVLRYLVSAQYRPAISVLRLLTADDGKPAQLDDHTFCMIIGARVALGDEPLHAELAQRLLESYSGTWLANCQGEVLEGLGGHPDDAAALVRHLGRPDRGTDFGATNIAYRRMLNLIVLMRAGTMRPRDVGAATAEPKARERIEEARRRWLEQSNEAKSKRATAILRKGLHERARWPYLASPGDADYSLHFVTMHMAALAGLGDADAEKRLYRIIDDESEQSGAAWLAAHWAIRLGLPGAREHAAALMARGVTYSNQEKRGVLQNIRLRLLNAYERAYPDDARWGLMLLDREQGNAAERALYLLSRRRLAGACAVVSQAVPRATPEAAEFALLALTTLGNRCRGDLKQLAENSALPAAVRGPALEVMAALAPDQAGPLIQRAGNDKDMRVYLQRARRIQSGAQNP